MREKLGKDFNANIRKSSRSRLRFGGIPLKAGNAYLRRFVIGYICDNLRVPNGGILHRDASGSRSKTITIATIGTIRGNLRSKIVFRQSLIICILITLLICANSVFADSIKIADLIKNALAYDGKRVTVEGEAIGHIMQRGDFVWFNVNDTTQAIGIWTTANLAKDIKYLGKHAVIGDALRIEGVFHLRCPGHGGDTDIHADKILVTQRGSARQLTHDPHKVNIIIFLTAILVCLYIIKILKRKR